MEGTTHIVSASKEGIPFRKLHDFVDAPRGRREYRCERGYHVIFSDKTLDLRRRKRVMLQSQPPGYSSSVDKEEKISVLPLLFKGSLQSKESLKSKMLGVTHDFYL